MLVKPCLNSAPALMLKRVRKYDALQPVPLLQQYQFFNILKAAALQAIEVHARSKLRSIPFHFVAAGGFVFVNEGGNFSAAKIVNHQPGFTKRGVDL